MKLPAQRSAFNDKILEEFPKVYNYVRRLVRRPEIAEDLTQEAFLKAWQAFDRYDMQKPFLPWVLQIARNTALDYFRKHREWPDSGQAPEPVDQAPSPEKSALEHESARHLEAALQQLPELQRTAVFLYYKEQLNIAGLAKVLRSTEGGVTSLLHRARQGLKKLLAAAETPEK
jgi:RNA polymerase sigma-70 factor (ECF subfamily)